MKIIFKIFMKNYPFNKAPIKKLYKKSAKSNFHLKISIVYQNHGAIKNNRQELNLHIKHIFWGRLKHQEVNLCKRVHIMSEG